MHLRPGERAVHCLECRALIAKEVGKLLEVRNGTTMVVAAVCGTASIECRRCHKMNVVAFGQTQCPLAGPGPVNASSIPMKC